MPIKFQNIKPRILQHNKKCTEYYGYVRTYILLGHYSGPGFTAPLAGLNNRMGGKTLGSSAFPQQAGKLLIEKLRINFDVYNPSV